VPHAEFVQLVPATLQVTAEFGTPALAICEVKACTAPSSTLALGGVTLTVTSLVIVKSTDALAAESAWLMACTVTFGD